MERKPLLYLWSILLFIASFQKAIAQNTATFDDLQLSVNTFWNGENNSGGFNNNGFFFENTYTSFGGGMYSWYGFAYSNMTDTLTSGYTNQFSAIPGKGALSSSNYAVSYVNYDWMNNYTMVPNIIRFANPQTISGFYACNNTYAYFSMLNGDGNLAKKFGGTNGNDPDWFKLQIKGYRNGIMTDTVNCFLADFRFTNNAQDYILKTWKWIDLSVLGDIDSLAFALSSSDQGSFGMNTPAYFCMDNFNGQNPNVAINNLNNNNFDVKIYPNPVLDNLYISIMNPKEVIDIYIYDTSGKDIVRYVNLTHEFVVNLSAISKGIYFVKIIGSDFTKYQKIIKK